MVLGPAHNDAAVRLAQAQRVMDAPWCLHWARQIVRAKLLRQRKTLRTWQAARPDARKPLSDALARLDTALVTLDAADPAPLDAASLRGLEGAAARAHFAGLAAVLRQSQVGMALLLLPGFHCRQPMKNSALLHGLFTATQQP